jgi:hypothetical protein
VALFGKKEMPAFNPTVLMGKLGKLYKNVQMLKYVVK